MVVTGKSSELQEKVAQLKAQHKTVGFVPTMGALHQGHLSLVSRSKRECDYTIVSIFVNPTQFNDKEDLRRYPRMPEEDSLLLEQVGCDMVFIPSESEIYPSPDTRIFDFGKLDKVMEGAFRPGHFNGVAQVVSRLFDIVSPHKAYFGAKDFQQLAIVRKLVQMVDYPIEVVSCDIVREPDGLAMSSRNMLLNPQQRAAAPGIYKAISVAKSKAEKLTPSELKADIRQQIDANPELKTEYVELVDAEEMLEPVHSWDTASSIQLCVAVQVGKIRLIDNIQVK